MTATKEKTGEGTVVKRETHTSSENAKAKNFLLFTIIVKFPPLFYMKLFEYENS